MTLPNSSSTNAKLPYKSTFRIVAGDACVGETPAASIIPVTVPIAVDASTGAWTDSREETSTVAEVTSKARITEDFGGCIGVFLAQVRQHEFRLPAPTRRAMAWPMDPAPMRTMTSLI